MLLTCKAAILTEAGEPVGPVEVRPPLSPGHGAIILQEVVIAEGDLLALRHVPDQDHGEAPGPALRVSGHSVVRVAVTRVIYPRGGEEHSTGHVTHTRHMALLVLKLETVGAQNSWKRV